MFLAEDAFLRHTVKNDPLDGDLFNFIRRSLLQPAAEIHTELLDRFGESVRYRGGALRERPPSAALSGYGRIDDPAEFRNIAGAVGGAREDIVQPSV